MNYLNQNNNIITTSQFIALGYSKALLFKYEKAGLLARVSHGVYSSKDVVVDDLFEIAKRSNNIVVSHESALFLNGLSDRTPFIHSVTIPSGKKLPASIKDKCICFYIKNELFKTGLIELKTTFGNSVQCYNPERTVCDLLRSRSRIDEETVISALKNYVASPVKDLNLLSDYSKQFGLEKKIRTYMEVLL